MVNIPELLLTGILILAGFYAGKLIQRIRLPSIIGFMLVGVILGPSLFNILDKNIQVQMDFITHIALGAVALSIGLELKLHTIWQRGPGLLIMILSQVFITFFILSGGIYFFTRDWVLALPLGAIATLTDPAGTMAVIQESKARGPVSKMLYAILGIDNGIGILIFGFALAIASSLLAYQTENHAGNTLHMIIAVPVAEALISLLIGIAVGFIFCIMLRTGQERKGVLVQTIAFLLITIGVCNMLGLSYIFALLITGTVVVNTQPSKLLEQLRRELTEFMPLLYILFFALAGSKILIHVIPAIGGIGILYLLLRTAGKISGAWVGIKAGKIKDQLPASGGIALLSQAGVAIGLALIVQNEFAVYGEIGADIGAKILTIVTASSILFEMAGPLLAEKTLKKAGEVKS